MKSERRSIRSILIAGYLIAMTISLIGGSVVVGRISRNTEIQRYYLDTATAIQNFSDLLMLVLNKTVDTTFNLSKSSEIQNVLSGQDKERLEASNYLKQIFIEDDAIEFIYILDKQQEIVFKYGQSADAIKERTFFGTLKKKNLEYNMQKLVIVPALSKNDAGYTLCIEKEIRSTEGLDKIGYIFVMLKNSAIQGKVEEFLVREKMDVMLKDETGNVLTFPYSSKIEAELRDSTNKLKLEQQGKCISCQIDREGLIGELTIRNIKSYSKSNIMGIFLSFAVINIVFLGVAIYIVGKCVVYPLEKVAEDTNKISMEKDLSVRFETNEGCLEIDCIKDALNEMMEKINLLVQEQKEKERMHSALQLSVISHQVNPHFLFNTLNSVTALIAMEDKDTAIKLVRSLARYYRVCLSKEEDTNSINREIEITKEYVNIMMLKNPDLVRVEYIIDESIIECHIPRMMIQILVENAIKYGIKTTTEPLKIKISINKDTEQDRIIIKVRDNGKGISQDIIQKIYTNHMQSDNCENKSGFGVNSIIKRIKLMYDIENIKQIICITSEENLYSEICIYIPYKKPQDTAINNI